MTKIYFILLLTVLFCCWEVFPQTYNLNYPNRFSSQEVPFSKNANSIGATAGTIDGPTFIILLGVGIKYFASYPQDQYKEGYARWKNSPAIFISPEVLLNRKGTHLLGCEVNVYNTGEYKAVITNVSPSIGYRYKYLFKEHFSISGKFAINLFSPDFLVFGFFHQALIFEYTNGSFSYFVQYRTDVVSTSPNFVFAGVGLNL